MGSGGGGLRPTWMVTASLQLHLKPPRTLEHLMALENRDCAVLTVAQLWSGSSCGSCKNTWLFLNVSAQRWPVSPSQVLLLRLCHPSSCRSANPTRKEKSPYRPWLPCTIDHKEATFFFFSQPSWRLEVPVWAGFVCSEVWALLGLWWAGLCLTASRASVLTLPWELT